LAEHIRKRKYHKDCAVAGASKLGPRSGFLLWLGCQIIESSVTDANLAAGEQVVKRSDYRRSRTGSYKLVTGHELS